MKLYQIVWNNNFRLHCYLRYFQSVYNSFCFCIIIWFNLELIFGIMPIQYFEIFEMMPQHSTQKVLYFKLFRIIPQYSGLFRILVKYCIPLLRNIHLDLSPKTLNSRYVPILLTNVRPKLVNFPCRTQYKKPAETVPASKAAPNRSKTWLPERAYDSYPRRSTAGSTIGTDRVPWSHDAPLLLCLRWMPRAASVLVSIRRPMRWMWGRVHSCMN